MGLERKDHVVEPDRLARDPHHPGDAETPDVRVEHADPVAVGGERAREVHRDARFADAALARRDGDHGGVSLREEGPLLLGPASEHPDEPGTLLLAHRAHPHVDARDAERLQRRRDVAGDALLKRASRDREEDVDTDGVAVHLDPGQHAEVLDRAADLGIVDPAERFANLGLGDQRALPRSVGGIILIPTVRIVLTPMVRPARGDVDAAA